LNLAVVEFQRGRLDQAILLADGTLKDSKDPALRTKARAFLLDVRRAR